MAVWMWITYLLNPLYEGTNFNELSVISFIAEQSGCGPMGIKTKLCTLFIAYVSVIEILSDLSFSLSVLTSFYNSIVYVWVGYYLIHFLMPINYMQEHNSEVN